MLCDEESKVCAQDPIREYREIKSKVLTSSMSGYESATN